MTPERRTTGAHHCPALFISAPASGQGKTTITAALAHHYRHQGRRVRVFKTGPDFLDPMVLEQASQAPVYQLDLWMGGEAHCRQLLYAAAAEADLILIEGVMGLFDGESSSADLAMLFDIPVLAVIDAGAMAQTFGAITQGLATYRPGLSFAGVFANRVAGDGHYRMLTEGLPEGLCAHGWLGKDQHIALPERHLGLVQASEVADLSSRIEQTATALQAINNSLPCKTRFSAPKTAPLEPRLKGVRIAIARDEAFAFLYRANLDLLQALGAELQFFSPLRNEQLPPADALYLPGGYPELHLGALAANRKLLNAIRTHYDEKRPIVAECGGMLYLLERLTDVQGQSAALAGVIPGHGQLQARLANLGLHAAELPEGTLKGHSFHYSILTTNSAPITTSLPARHGGRGEAVYRLNRLTASYLHWYFPSNPEASAGLFQPEPAR